MTDSWDRSYSWSKMNTYKTCPRQFKYKYIDELEETIPSEARSDGINFHEYMERYYSTMSTPEEGPKVDHAVTIAQDMFEPHMQAKYRPWIEMWHDWNTKLYSVYGEDHWTPVFMELWVEVSPEEPKLGLMPGEVHHGYVDRVQWDPVRESYGIIDYKGSGKDNSRVKGQTAYYGDILLEISDHLDAPADWAGVYGYKDGNFKRWQIHGASTNATKRKINNLRELKEGFEPKFGYHCEWCPYQEECSLEEAENEGLLGA